MIIWHPEVHHAYGEQLYLFLIRSRFFSHEYGETLEELLKTKARFAWALFETLGPYDFMARVWLTSAKYIELRQGILDKMETLELQEFRSSRVRYLWNGDSKNNLNSASLLRFGPEKLEQFQENPSDNLLKAALLKEGLLLEDKCDRQNERGRFYCLVSSPGDRNFDVTPNLEAEVIGLATEMNINSISIYRGDGFAKLVIKGDTNDMSVTHEFPVRLRQLMSFGPRIRTETILARARTPHLQVDCIDFTAAGTAPDLLLSYAQLVGQALPSEGHPTALEVLEVFKNIRSVFPIDADGYLRRTMRAWSGRSSVELKLGAIPILEVEGLLKEYFRRKMEQAFGNDWAKTGIPTISVKAELPDVKKSMNFYTYTDYVSCLGALAKEKGLALEDELGPQWQDALRRFEKIRNRYAHDIEQQMSTPLRLFEDLREALPLYYRLRANVEKDKKV